MHAQVTDGINVCITTELAVAVGEIAKRHMDAAIEIRWVEGSPEQTWIVTAVWATDGDTAYEVDDETGDFRLLGQRRVGDHVELAWMAQERSTTPRRVVGTIASFTAGQINVRRDGDEKIIAVPTDRIVGD